MKMKTEANENERRPTMANDVDTVREVCAEMKDRENLDGRDMCDNFHIEYGDYGGFDGLELIKAYADRILAAYEREMAAKNAEIARLKAALKPVMECVIMPYLQPESLNCHNALNAVNEAQRVMR